jgi:hypothetical protein
VETGCIPNYCQQQFVCVNCLSGTFRPPEARWARDLYYDRATTRQGLRFRANIFPIVSFTKIKVFAKARPDLIFKCPTVDEESSEDVEPGIPMIVVNAYELWFLVGQ